MHVSGMDQKVMATWTDIDLDEISIRIMELPRSSICHKQCPFLTLEWIDKSGNNCLLVVRTVRLSESLVTRWVAYFTGSRCPPDVPI